MSLILISIGFLVCAGWVLGLHPLLYVLHGWPTMKFITALSFVFTGCMLLALQRSRFSLLAGSIAFGLLFTHAGWIGMTSVGVPLFFPYAEADNIINIAQFGGPSLGVGLGFISIALFGVLAPHSPPRKMVVFFATIPGVIGAVGFFATLPISAVVVNTPDFVMPIHASLGMLVTTFAMLRYKIPRY